MSKREERGSQGPHHASVTGQNEGLVYSKCDGKPSKFRVIEGTREEEHPGEYCRVQVRDIRVPGNGGSRETGQSQNIS